MKTSEAARLWLGYHKTHSKKNAIRAYENILSKFSNEIRDKDLYELTSDEVLAFLNAIAKGKVSHSEKKDGKSDPGPPAVNRVWLDFRWEIFSKHLSVIALMHILNVMSGTSHA